VVIIGVQNDIQVVPDVAHRIIIFNTETFNKLKDVQTTYRFGKSSSFDLNNFFISVDDVTMKAHFRFFYQLYLSLGANQMSHFLAQKVFVN